MQGIERVLTDIALAIGANKKQEGWIVPTLSNGWVNYLNGYDTIAFMKDTLGFVHIKGMIKSGTTTPGTTIFTLPVGYRPSGHCYLVSGFCASATVGAFEIRSDGIFNILQGNASYTGLGHIVFRAEN